METITITDTNLTFQVVDTIPAGYEVWNIGNHMPAGYIPVCQLSPRRPFDGLYDVDTRTLKAVKTPDAEHILRAAARGFKTIYAMESYITNCSNSDWLHEENLSVLEKAIPAMRQICSPAWHDK